MKDNRIEKLADILVNYSTKVKRGETILISSSDLGKPLVTEVYKKVLKAGGYPLVDIQFEELRPIFFNLAEEHQLTNFPVIKEFEAKNIQANIVISAPNNRKAMSNTNPDRLITRSKVLKPIKDHIVENVRWVIVNFPTNSLAQEAEMSLEEYEDFVFQATNIDWTEMDKKQTKFKDLLDKSEIVRIKGKDTDIVLSIKGREAIKCAGAYNMPDGEIFLSPLEDSANGYILFDYPAIYNGREVDGVRLEFKDGKIIKATAEKNSEYLNKLLDTDAGARFLGELGIGMNYGIKKFTKDILFDEKIGGTIHLAAGQSYKEAGGKNNSAIHWDMIKDLKSGGEIFLDDTLVQKDGRFLVEL
ncbi:MAG: aminopeptidase [bacterium]